MFPNRCIFVLLAAWAAATFAAPPASDAEVERYERLIDDIRDFKRYDNAEMNDLIFAGLHSDNPRVVELTIAAMNRESSDRHLRRDVDVPSRFREELGKHERDLARVPGIKDFLIDYASDGLAQHGWKAIGEFDFYEKNLWKLVPALLASYFPGDPDVRRLLRAGPADNPHGIDTQRYLMYLLNAGAFVDEEADELRVALLADEDPITVGSAAHGLALSGSKVGLEAMGRLLWRRDEALGEIVTAMAAYGARAAPHMAALRELGPEERKPLALAKHLSRRDEALAEVVDAIACYGGRAAPHLPALQALSTQAASLPEAARTRIASATDKVAKLAALRQEKLADQAPL